METGHVFVARRGRLFETVAQAAHDLLRMTVVFVARLLENAWARALRALSCELSGGCPFGPDEER
jgi:hypothetical protein